MKITSSEFNEDQPTIPPKYTCNRDNISPPLEFENVPDMTKSLVLIVDDVDTPAGGITHWLVFNIDPKVREVKEGETPRGGVVGVNSFEKNDYSGPCPPENSLHNYDFQLFALNKKLNLDKNADKAAVVELMDEKDILAKAVLRGSFERISDEIQSVNFDSSSVQSEKEFEG